MPEWSTYSLSDFLMFSSATWYRLLELHNTVWSPLQALATLAAGGLLWAVRGTNGGRARAALALAGLAWLFVAWAFHWVRYDPINWAASYFAYAFGLQGLLLLRQAWVGRELRPVPDVAGRAGQALLLLALLHPLLALAWGRPLAQSEWFGLMPDPTVLATLGLMLSLRRGALLPIPLLWCAVTGATLWTLGAGDWFVLPLAGILALAIVVWRGFRPAATGALPSRV